MRERAVDFGAFLFELTSLVLVKAALTVAAVGEVGALNKTNLKKQSIQQVVYFLYFAIRRECFVFILFCYLSLILCTLSLANFFTAECTKNNYFLSRMIILASLDILTKGVKFAFLLALLRQLVLQTLTLRTTFTLLALLTRHTTHCTRARTSIPFVPLAPVLLRLIAFLLFFFLFLLGLFLGLLGLGVDIGLHLLLLRLLFAFLGLFCSLELYRFGLPLNHLFGNDVYNSLVLNACSDVLLEFVRIALAVEVGVEEHSKIPA